MVTGLRRIKKIVRSAGPRRRPRSNRNRSAASSRLAEPPLEPKKATANNTPCAAPKDSKIEDVSFGAMLIVTLPWTN